MRDGVFTVMWPSHLRIDSLSFGVLIAYLWEFRPAFIDRVAKARWKLLGASLLLISPCFVWPDGVFMHTVGLSFLYCGFGGLLVFAMKNISGQSLVVSGLAQIGMYSYTIYLIHVPVLHWVTGHPISGFYELEMSAADYQKNLLGVNLACVRYLILSICLGTLVAKIVELPALRLRDKLIPRGAPLLDQAAATMSSAQ